MSWKIPEKSYVLTAYNKNVLQSILMPQVFDSANLNTVLSEGKFEFKLESLAR